MLAGFWEVDVNTSDFFFYHGRLHAAVDESEARHAEPIIKGASSGL